jgi:hypothetical protein
LILEDLAAPRPVALNPKLPNPAEPISWTNLSISHQVKICQNMPPPNKKKQSAKTANSNGPLHCSFTNSIPFCRRLFFLRSFRCQETTKQFVFYSPYIMISRKVSLSMTTMFWLFTHVQCARILKARSVSVSPNVLSLVIKCQWLQHMFYSQIDRTINRSNLSHGENNPFYEEGQRAISQIFWPPKCKLIFVYPLSTEIQQKAMENKH